MGKNQLKIQQNQVYKKKIQTHVPNYIGLLFYYKVLLKFALFSSLELILTTAHSALQNDAQFKSGQK